MKRIFVGSLQAAKRFRPAPGERYGVLSLIDTPTAGSMRAPRIARLPGFVVRLIVEADDCEPADERDSTGHLHLLSLSEEQARQIARFVYEYHSQLDTLVIHCVAGLSRSPAAAYAIASALGIENIEGIALSAFPNRHVRRLLGEALELLRPAASV